MRDPFWFWVSMVCLVGMVVSFAVTYSLVTR